MQDAATGEPARKERADTNGPDQLVSIETFTSHKGAK